MSTRMFFRSLQAKFILPVAALVVIATFVLVVVISAINSRSIEQSAKRESLEKLAYVEEILAVTDAIMLERVKSSLLLLRQRAGSIGAPHRGNPVKMKGRPVPDLLFGNQQQANRHELVDGVISSQGGNATLFSRDGEEFVQISTNLRRGLTRTVGSLLDPDGRAIQAIRQGKPFYGQVDILGIPHIAGYEPMFDGQNNLIGVWYAGYPVDMQALQVAIASSRILGKGFMVLMDATGEIRFSSDNVAPDRAQNVAKGSVPGWALVKKTFTPWGFELVAAYPEEEVREAVRGAVSTVVVAGLLLGGILIGLLFWLARLLVIAPIVGAVELAGKIAEGNLDCKVTVRRQDEIGVLLGALNHMQESLKKLDQMKTDFLSSVSHELRTPLTSIRGFATLIDREFSRSFAPLAGEDVGLGKKSRRISENLSIILKESERLTRIINDVLDLAKIEAGRIDWRDARIGVDTLVGDAINAMQGMFDVRPEVALCYEIQAPPPVVFGDADRLHQVLVNLLNNAAKFTERGEVRVAAFINDKHRVQIEIRDTGSGFPPEDAEKIFDKFQQASHGDTLTDKPKGTGLGLAIAHEIVERHGGRIWASSTPGVGSVFAIELPLAAAVPDDAQKVGAGGTAQDAKSANRTQDGQPNVEAASAALPPNLADYRRMRVLVVDDDPAVRSYFVQLLQEQDYEVVTAADGEAALAAARRYTPDLITMDLAMPVMDGRTAIGQLRADPDLARIPIMVISALPGWDAAGGDVAMSKPLDEQRFIDNIHTLLADDVPGREIELLVLCRDGDERTHFPLRFTARCHIDYCPLADLEPRIRAGFQGMLAIPVDLLGKMDIDGLHAQAGLKVMILPTPSDQLASRLEP